MSSFHIGYEVRKTSNIEAGLGVFATTSIACGATILSDPNPLHALPIGVTLSQGAQPGEEHPEEKLRLYAQSFINSKDDDRRQWLELCAPVITKELTLRVNKVATEALSSTLVTPLPSPSDVSRAVVVAMANCFEDGLLYVNGLSRFNHSCEPNAIYLPTEDNGKHVKALRDIATGEEITISYLGLKIYVGKDERLRVLRDTKFFDCSCARCQRSEPDFTRTVPCPFCHPRSQAHSLPEEVMWEEVDVSYVQLSDSGPNAAYCKRCTTTLAPSHPCISTESKATLKILSFLSTPSSSSSSPDDMEVDEDTEMEDEMNALSLSVLGPRHWATVQMQMLALDRSCHEMNRKLLVGGSIEEVELAEAIDMCERLFNWFGGLGKFGGERALTKQCITIARALVSFDDDKSKAYGREWLKKVEGWVNTFEHAALQKAVAAIKGEVEEGGGGGKKIRR